MIIEQIAEDEGLDRGRPRGVSTRTGVQPVTIAGLAEFGDAQSIGGATLIVAPPGGHAALVRRARRGLEHRRRGRRRRVAGAARAQAALALPRDLKVETGEQNAQAKADEINDADRRLPHARAARPRRRRLLVGGFIIFNTFSITVAQRTREFGLLRAMGATRRQILGRRRRRGARDRDGRLGGRASPRASASRRARRLFDAAGFGIPADAPELAPRTIIVVARRRHRRDAHRRARAGARATRVPPVAALSYGAPEVTSAPPAPARRSPPRPSASLGCCSSSRASSAAGPPSARLGSLAGGAVLVFVGDRARRALHRPPARRRDRLAAGARLRRARPARARERDAQPGADRHDLRGAHGRARPRRLRRGLRRRPEVVDLRQPRRPREGGRPRHREELPAAAVGRRPGDRGGRRRARRCRRSTSTRCRSTASRSTR